MYSNDKPIYLASLPTALDGVAGRWTGRGALWPHHKERKWPWPFSETQYYEFLQDHDSPLTWTIFGRSYRVPDKLITDLGTTPPFLHAFVPPTAFVSTFIFHDRICEVETLLARNEDSDGEWMLTEVPRKQGDLWLVPMILAEGGTSALARIVSAACRAWAWVKGRRAA